MRKVITYGTYDLLHHGHVRLLERAKALGDYLVVGVTSGDFDRRRGKINVQQTLEDRIAAVQATGIPDKVIVEEYEGQKIDDIRKYDIDVFTVGSDWEGYFDYLESLCDVIYLPRTEGVSSSELRSSGRSLRVGLVGYSPYLDRVYRECGYVNGAEVVALCVEESFWLDSDLLGLPVVTNDYERLLSEVDAVYIHSHPGRHHEQAKQALEKGKHVMCEAPVAWHRGQADELMEYAQKRGLVLMDSLRTAYSTAYERMLLMVKSGCIGDVVSVDATCTSLNSDGIFGQRDDLKWGSMNAWGPTAMLPVLQLLGTDYEQAQIVSRRGKECESDVFSEVIFRYSNAVATSKMGSGVKSEGSLVVSGTKGYVYVPSPWWKMEYFEVRCEDPAKNRRFFYQLDGEGIRYEWVSFLKAISSLRSDKTEGSSFGLNIDKAVTLSICSIMEEFESGGKVLHI